MLKALKFCQGAVAKDDAISSMTHFQLGSGRIRSFNGIMSLSSPIPLDIECKPKAIAFTKAVERCKDSVAITMTGAGRLKVTSGKFKVFVDCIQDEIPEVFPEGEAMKFDGKEILSAIRSLLPLVSTNPNHKWANGILIDGKSAFATNNVILVERWLGLEFPRRCVIPLAALKELVRLGDPPTHAQFATNSVTFHYEGDRWFRTQLITDDWPDLRRILGREHDAKELPLTFFKGMDNIGPFAEAGHVYFHENMISTAATMEEGANFEIEGFDFSGVYDYKALMLLKGFVKKIDFSSYPLPALFFGDNMRGAVVGIKP